MFLRQEAFPLASFQEGQEGQARAAGAERRQEVGEGRVMQGSQARVISWGFIFMHGEHKPTHILKTLFWLGRDGQEKAGQASVVFSNCLRECCQ